MDINKLIPGYALSLFEAYCAYELLLFFKDKVYSHRPKEIYGDANLLVMFTASGLQVDLAIFLYEYIEILDVFSPDDAELLEKDEDYLALKQIRMNMHTYNKSGGYHKDAAKIIDAQSEAFEMDKRDAAYILRNDISLIYEIRDNKMLLCGSNYYWSHIFKGVEEKSYGFQLRDFVAKSTILLKGLRQTVNETSYNMPKLKERPELPLVEGIDFKSADLFNRTQLNKGHIIRLLSMLTQLSYGLFLTDSLLDRKILNNNLWYCYFLKILSIKFDESIDNIQSMLSHGRYEDRETLNNILDINGIGIETFQTLDIACELRNTIHFKDIKLNGHLVGDTTASYIEALYISNAAGESMADLRAWGDRLYREARQLRDGIRRILGLDRDLIA